MKNVKEYWNSYYSEKPFANGKEPSGFLSDMLPRLQKGKALDVAMGEGKNSVFLAQKGFEVKGFDISDKAIENAKAHAAESGVPIDAKPADLDLFLLGIMEYDTIIMFDFKPATKRYYSELTRALKQGGTLIIEGELQGNMSADDIKSLGSAKGFFAPNELLASLRDLQIQYYHEFDQDGKLIVQCLAKKPLDKDAVKYKLFDMHSDTGETKKSNHEQALESLFKK